MSGVLPGSVRDVRGCVRDVLLVSRFWSPALSGVSCRCPAYVPPCPAMSRHVPPMSRHVPPMSRHVPPLSRHVPPMSRPCPAMSRPCPARVPPVSRHVPPVSRPCPVMSRVCPATSRPCPATSRPMSQNTTGQLTYTWTPFCCPRDFLAMPISCPAVFREPFASEGTCNQTDIKIISAVHEDTRSRLSLQAQSSKEFKPYCE